MSKRSWIRNLFIRPATHPIRKGPTRARLGVEALEDRTVPSTFTVTNTLDDGSVGSLRWAVGEANTTAGADTIDFANPLFSTPQTITLSGTQLTLSDMTGATSITGPAAGVTVSGNNASRVFQVNDLVTASISGMTITGGSVAGYGYGGSVSGGGIANFGTLTMTGSTVSGNTAYSYSYYGSSVSGGGIANSGILTLTGSTVSGNSAFSYYGSGSGGGISNSGTLTLTGSTVSGNSVTGNPAFGGGIANSGSMTLTGSTVSGNSSSSGGGGIANSGSMTLTDSTVSGNSNTGNPDSREGGGIQNSGTAALTHATVSGNTSGQGGGISNSGSMTLTDSTVSGNSATRPAGGPANQGGGGIRNRFGGTMMLADTTVSGNTANNAGGGIINDAGMMTLDGSTVSNNSATFIGGGISGSGSMTLNRTTVSVNSSNNTGGGIFFGTGGNSTMTLTDSTVSGNSARLDIGGIFSGSPTTTVTLIRSTVSGNSAGRDGGGLFTNGQGNLVLVDSTVSGNSAGRDGGGMNRVSGTITLTSSTVSGNSAVRDGGGIKNGVTLPGPALLRLTNCTVSGNAAAAGGGVWTNSGAAALTNTIVAGQTAGGDVFGTVSGSNNLIGGNPLLAPLGDYGGPTQTMPPLPGSPALDAGTSGAGIPATDQRGLGRIGAVDIGAVERQAPTITMPGAQTAYEDVDLLISGISVSGDPQGSTPFTLTLAVGHGTLTFANTSGLTVTGNGSDSVSLSGSIADINAALAGLVYRGSLNYGGPDTLSLSADDGNLSNLSTLASVVIDVKSAAQQATDLQAQVRGLGLNHGRANSLIVKLNLKGNNGDIGKVQAFLNEVSALLNAGIVTQTQADALLYWGNILLLSVTRR